MKKKLHLIIIAVALLSFPVVNFAQTINLGAAGNFVLFTTAGAITNSGTTYLTKLTGHVGSNSGSSTGFGNVNGGMYDGGVISGQAATDLIAANGQLAATIPTNFPAPLLGNGGVLNAGVYSMAAPSVISGELILDAQGNANAEFIFKISGTLAVNANAKVRLLNGAQACNVYWKVDAGAVSLAGNTFMKGTIVANGGAINLNVNDTLEGRALSISGAINTNSILAYTPPGCAKIQLTGPAAPNLASAGCYAILSGNGSVTNSGVSNITGDVGTNVGLTVGFNALTVNGTVHPIADASTNAAAADLLTAYTYLNGLPEDIILLYPAQFGHNLVLTPHTYLMNGATTFTDSIYLNAEGNTNAVFVLKLKGAIITSVNSKVLLINGAQAKNVYWMIDGAVNIKDNSIFNGTIVCNSGAIDLATGVVVNGRSLTTGGALSATSTSSMTVLSPSGDCRPLPVSWLYFRGKPVQQNVLLEWATSNEMNNGFFTLEKSKDGQRFETITTVNATKATGMAERNYSFTDQQPYSLGYYRISQTDKDGQVNPYNTIQVKLNATSGFTERHYVRANYIHVRASGATPGKGSIELYSIEGKKMASQNIILTKEESTYKIDKLLPRGMYLLYIHSQGEKLFTGKVMIP